MSHRTGISIAVLSLATLAGVGCRFGDAPRFRVLAVEEASRTDEAVVLRFTLEARNRTDDQLPLRQADYALDLDGRRVFSGSRSAEVTVGSFATQPFTLPAVVPIADAAELLDGRSEVSYALSGRVEYITPGQLAEVLFDSGLRRTTAPLGARGVLELE
ncbi:MAG: LEA type 2 family protein [Planctomycetota bacterium]